MPTQPYDVQGPLPRANSSSISRSRSCADIERYSAVTLYLLEALTERVAPPSLEDPIVFCREIGENTELVDDALFLVEGASIATDITIFMLFAMRQLDYRSF
jgi:hypothetical protein